MSANASLARYMARLETCSALRWQGRVTQVVGPLVESEGPFCSVGEICHVIDARGRVLPGEIVGFRGTTVLSMPLELPRGVRYGDRVVTWGERPTLRVSEDVLGRVMDGSGQPLDTQPQYRGQEYRLLDAVAPLPLERVPIREPIGCGIRAVDAFLTCGRGQRIGIFGGSGVGKSTLIGMMARNTSADLTVLGLVGERGREVRDFLENALGEEGRKRAVVVVSTSDQSPMLSHPRSARGDRCRRIFLRAREARAAGGGLAHPAGHGAARDWFGRGRTAHRQRLHTFVLCHAGPTDRAGGKIRPRQHYGVLHGFDGRGR